MKMLRTTLKDTPLHSYRYLTQSVTSAFFGRYNEDHIQVLSYLDSLWFTR